MTADFGIMIRIRINDPDKMGIKENCRVGE